MGRIRVLDDGLIDRIAAGEVVERPASVVKELVENAVDAGARRITVELAGGGRRRIRVEDDGHGMDADDARLALERHATSKLAGPDDLDAIATLGFRGEALSSIAAVSRLTLRTATGDGPGTEIEVDGGRLVAVREIGAPRGTTILVERLFGNVPARRKFLRTEATELSHILRWATRYAMAYPSLGLRVEQKGRRLLDVVPAADLRERVEQIHGRAFVETLLPFRLERGGIEVAGLAGRPVDALPRRDAQHYVVNGRAVQDRVLSHAVHAAYGNTMPKGRYPAIVLELRLPPTEVDVNVHPQKTEVRFRHGGAIHDLVRAAVASALGDRAAVPTLGELRPAGAAAEAAREGIREAARGWQSRVDHAAASDASHSPAAPVERPVPGPSRPLAWDGPEASPVRALAQYRDSYIVAEDERGLVLDAQPAAHERVLFEAYLAEAEENRVEVQGLLFPATFELAPAEHVLVVEQADEFRRLGFVVEPFGGSSVKLDGVPALAKRLDPERLFRELVGEAGRARAAAADVDALRHRLVTTAACHAAITVNTPLAVDAMQVLLDRLFAVSSPSTCPHGRPALFRVELDELERAFRRR